MDTWLERHRRQAEERYRRLDAVLAAMNDSAAMNNSAAMNDNDGKDGSAS
jgi:ferritin-like metal-binding protein YciE